MEPPAVQPQHGARRAEDKAASSPDRTQGKAGVVDSSESEGEDQLIDFSSYVLKKDTSPEQFGIDISRASWAKLKLTNYEKAFILDGAKAKSMLRLVRLHYINYKNSAKTAVPTPPIEELERHVKYLYKHDISALSRLRVAENNSGKFFQSLIDTYYSVRRASDSLERESPIDTYITRHKASGLAKDGDRSRREVSISEYAEGLDSRAQAWRESTLTYAQWDCHCGRLTDPVLD